MRRNTMCQIKLLYVLRMCLLYTSYSTEIPFLKAITRETFDVSGGMFSRVINNNPRYNASDQVTVLIICLLYTFSLKVGSWSFEYVINLLIYCLNCRKTLFTRK